VTVLAVVNQRLGIGLAGSLSLGMDLKQVNVNNVDLNIVLHRDHPAIFPGEVFDLSDFSKQTREHTFQARSITGGGEVKLLVRFFKLVSLNI
jgi:hypothetical protein